MPWQAVSISTSTLGAFQGQQSLAVFFKVRQEHPSYWIFLNKNHTEIYQWLGKPKKKTIISPSTQFSYPFRMQKVVHHMAFRGLRHVFNEQTSHVKVFCLDMVFNVPVKNVINILYIYIRYDISFISSHLPSIPIPFAISIKMLWVYRSHPRKQKICEKNPAPQSQI